MNKLTKIILGILSFWPLIMMATIILLVFLNFFGAQQILYSFITSDFNRYLTIIIVIAMPVYYIVDVIRKKRGTEKTIFWIVSLILFNAIASPIYWYKYIWREK